MRSNPQIFENKNTFDKFKEKKFISVKIYPTMESNLDKLKKFLMKEKLKKRYSKKSNQEQTINLSNNAQTKAETKIMNETEIDHSIYISKSFLSTKRENLEDSSISSLNSVPFEIEKVNPNNKKILTSNQAFKKKFIKNLAEDYVPKILTTDACIHMKFTKINFKRL